MTERLLTHGSILPSERKMSQTLELSRVTVVKALDALLEAEIDGDRLTERGAMLTRIYNELDLLVAESIRDGVFDDLEVPALAAVLSSLVYESRGDQQGQMRTMPDWMPTFRVWNFSPVLSVTNATSAPPKSPITMTAPASR